MNATRKADAVFCSCGKEAEPYYDEVDIGVGVQTFLTGWECHEHGGICGACNTCSIPEQVGRVHHGWCSEHPGETITAEAFNDETDRLGFHIEGRGP